MHGDTFRKNLTIRNYALRIFFRNYVSVSRECKSFATVKKRALFFSFFVERNILTSFAKNPGRIPRGIPVPNEDAAVWQTIYMLRPLEGAEGEGAVASVNPSRLLNPVDRLPDTFWRWRPIPPLLLPPHRPLHHHHHIHRRLSSPPHLINLEHGPRPSPKPQLHPT